MKVSKIVMVVNAGFFSLLLSSPIFAAAAVEQIPPIVSSQKINLNTADLKTLTHSLKGIGKKRAEAIIAYRVAHPFKSVEELGKVKGFGMNYVKAHTKDIEEKFSVQ